MERHSQSQNYSFPANILNYKKLRFQCSFKEDRQRQHFAQEGFVCVCMLTHKCNMSGDVAMANDTKRVNCRA